MGILRVSLMPLFWAYFEGLGALGMCHYSICRIKGIHGNLPITKKSLFAGRCIHVTPSLVLKVTLNWIGPSAAQPRSVLIGHRRAQDLFLKYKSQSLQQSIRNHGSWKRVLHSHAGEAQHLYCIHGWAGQWVVLPCGMAQ